MQAPVAKLRLMLLQRCWLRLQSAVSENSTFEVILGFRLKQFFFNNSLGSWEIIQNYKMKKEQQCEMLCPYHAFTKYKETCGAGKTEVRFHSVMLMYLHDWPRPCGGTVVVVDIVSSSLCVLSLFPSGGQALCGHCVTCCRGRLAKCRKKAKAINKKERILDTDIKSR